jgi:hypothetical protein
LGPARGPKEIIERVNQNVLLVQSLKADARLKSDRIPQSRLARAELLFARPDRYRVRLKTIFGTTMAVLTARQGQTELYLPMSNRLYEGRLTAEQVQELVGVKLSAEELLEALSGLFTLPAMGELLEHRMVQDGHLLMYPWNRGSRQVTVAEDGFRILSIRYRDAFGDTVLEKRFDRHHLVEHLVLPERVRIYAQGQREILEVQFFSQQVNAPWDEGKFQLHLPSSVERIQLDLEYH